MGQQEADKNNIRPQKRLLPNKRDAENLSGHSLESFCDACWSVVFPTGACE